MNEHRMQKVEQSSSNYSLFPQIQSWLLNSHDAFLWSWFADPILTQPVWSRYHSTFWHNQSGVDITQHFDRNQSGVNITNHCDTTSLEYISLNILTTPVWSRYHSTLQQQSWVNIILLDILRKPVTNRYIILRQPVLRRYHSTFWYNQSRLDTTQHHDTSSLE